MATELSRVEKYFGNPEVLLGFMRRTRKPVFHKSNIFFRDVQFAIRDYFDTVEREPITVPEAETMAKEVIERYMQLGILREVNNNAFRLDLPEFATPKAGTYAMLTIHGAPLPGEAEESLEIATAGTAADPSFIEEPGKLKGGDVSHDGAKLAELTLPIAPPANAERGHLHQSDARSGAPEEPHKDPQSVTNAKPKPTPPWVKRN